MQKTIVQVIEDDEILSNTIKDELEGEGFEVIQSFDGEEGLKIAKENKPDIILLDIIMPKLDGIAVLKMLKLDANIKNIPVIILTVYGDMDKISDTIELGAKAYFIKDQQKLSEVVKTVKEILNNKN
ncbi:MAG: response regulator [Candidatus Pacebacteria bacterium]|nr:response regulator [Candidatus Paceibacterota bacterium]